MLLEMLVLRLLEDEGRILVPVDKAMSVGLREVIGSEDAERIWLILRERARDASRSGVPWSRRFRDYQEKLKRGSIFDIAEVLADLLQLQLDKELSFGEQRMLDSARSRIVHELAAAQGIPTATVEAEIRALVGQPGVAPAEPVLEGSA